MTVKNRTEVWTTNPATGERLKPYLIFQDLADVQPLLLELTKGFSLWKKLSFQDRQKKLLPTVKLFEAAKKEIALEITLQMGKPLAQALVEIDKCIESIQYMCTHGYKEFDPQYIETTQQMNEVHHRPLGVILSVMPWNFPLWQVIRMIYPALLMGNVILLKHSEITASIGVLVEKIFSKLDYCVLKNILFDHSLTEDIIADSKVSGVSLTGSTNAGYKLSEYAGRHLKRGVFELGGSDAYLVLDDADIKLSAQTILKSRLHNTGQTCISAKRAFVSKNKIELFLTEMKAELINYQFGDLMSPKTQLAPLASVQFKKDYLEKRKLIDAYVSLEMSIQPPSSDLESRDKAFVPVEILRIKDIHSLPLKKIMNDLEFFSPTLLVYVYDTEGQAIELLNSTKYGLGSAIFTTDVIKAKKMAANIEAGICVINGLVKSDVRLPFGGFKSSGLGRETGIIGFYEFTQTQVISYGRPV